MASDKGPVEGLKERLYSRVRQPQVDPSLRTPLSGSRAPADGSWKEESSSAATSPVTPIELMMSQKKRRSSSSYFLIGSVLFFLIAAGIAAYTLLVGFNTISPQNIDVQIVAPSLIDSGKGATIQYLIDNRNAAALLSADIIIDYPDGTRSQNDPTVALPHERIPIGTIEQGQQMKQTSSALFFGAEGSQKKISATLEYQIAGSNAIFVKQSEVIITIGSSPVSVAISAPDEAIAGQPFSVDLVVSSNATSQLRDIVLQAQYPFGFSVGDTAPAASAGGTLWRIGTLEPGSSVPIHITGTLSGEDGDQRVIHFLTGSESDQTATRISVPLLSVPHTFTIHKPFIESTLMLDGRTGATIALPIGKPVSGTIAWRNNLAESVSDLSFVLSLRGAAIDPASVSVVNGFYNSNTQQITWNGSQDGTLSVAAPGASGSLQFSFTTRQQSGRFSNQEVSLDLAVHASRQGAGAPEDITSAASTKVELSSAVALSASSLHFGGPFAQTGPMPPAVGKTTTYAIVWTVKNTSNALGNAVVSAVLPPYVSFIGAGTGGNERVSYDGASRTVTWTLGDVKAGTGYTSLARTAAFQISLTPSVSQAGSVPPLTGAAKFSANDRFAQTQVTASAEAPTTELKDDSGFSRGMEIVGN